MSVSVETAIQFIQAKQLPTIDSTTSNTTTSTATVNNNIFTNPEKVVLEQLRCWSSLDDLKEILNVLEMKKSEFMKIHQDKINQFADVDVVGDSTNNNNNNNNNKNDGNDKKEVIQDLNTNNTTVDKVPTKKYKKAAKEKNVSSSSSTAAVATSIGKDINITETVNIVPATSTYGLLMNTSL